ncbi:hypothetical protein EB796_020871 [Bugula neritina]|uniref:Endonuclease/exonuclease/phosphatase domain-containing protein n=1 Tax=Bugula neritina TaxID=10212 RepID=A0A7J7J537_BUGNE|nr:hypothetical protein EB796_020871 [Bugula neritina]
MAEWNDYAFSTAQTTMHAINNVSTTWNINPITAIYRQPSSDTGRFTDDLHNFLHSISHADHNHIITGDINIDILKQESDSYTDLLHQYSYTHLIEHPTITLPKPPALV